MAGDGANAQPEHVLEIGLVMAGAVSAGAYTAGVLDFLLQALDEWESAKTREPGCPKHSVKISAVAGSSAGGMCAAIFGTRASAEYSPVTTMPGTPPPEAVVERNPLYRSWVDRIDIDSLLGGSDLTGSKPPVVSILDSTRIDEIAEEAITFKSAPKVKRPYIADELDLILTVTNLSGVPYEIDFTGMTGEGHGMVNHADHFHFVVSDSQPDEPPALGGPPRIWLDRTNPDQGGWAQLRKVALATGAFPIGLAPRPLQRQSSVYNDRLWDRPVEPYRANGECVCVKTDKIGPRWPLDCRELENPQGSFPYDFLSIDGGVMNNEPFELARKALSKGARNPRSASKMTHTVIMVDPFSSFEPISCSEATKSVQSYDVVSVAAGMFSAMTAQARFKLDELKLAQEENVYSRYLIAPRRRDGNDDVVEHPLASGCLGAFGGFLSHRFRQHDFQLGRRNCQKFLRDALVVPLEDARENVLFHCGDPDALVASAVDVGGARVVPMIPLCGSARDEVVYPIPWGTLTFRDEDLARLRSGLKSRLKLVSSRIIGSRLKSSRVVRIAAWLAQPLWLGKAVNAVSAKIECELKKYGLR